MELLLFKHLASVAAVAVDLEDLLSQVEAAQVLVSALELFQLLLEKFSLLSLEPVEEEQLLMLKQKMDNQVIL